MRWWAVLLVGLGCGGSPAAPEQPSPACQAASAAAAAAWGQVAEQAVVPPVESGPSPIDGAVEQLHAHVAGLHERPDEVDGDTALALSGTVMDALDALDGVPRSWVDRTDRAAEALLTDRTPAGSLNAARGAVAALEGALEASCPEMATRRSARIGIERLRRRAQSTAEGYGVDGRTGDRRAQRAESAEVPESMLDSLREPLAQAVAASRTTRQECRFARTLAVPSL